MSTIHSAIYAIAWAHKKAGKKSPTEHTLVKQMVEASQRIVDTRVDNTGKLIHGWHFGLIETDVKKVQILMNSRIHTGQKFVRDTDEEINQKVHSIINC